MKITAKLAYTQLMKNRTRTFWTLLAIALSTALMVTVCSFFASGNAMIVDFLGPDYGEYATAYMSLLLLPLIFLGLMIVTMSVVVISNIFYISANERISEFGILKCVGTTEKQILSIVLYESVMLSSVGITLGVVFGLVLTIVAINVLNIYLNYLTTLVNIMINEISFSLEFVFSWEMILVASIICFFTVLFSAWKPAHTASKASAINSIRGTGIVKIHKNKLRKSRVLHALFGFEGELALTNIHRNRKNFKGTVIALTTGVVLFVCLGSLSGQANQFLEYTQMEHDKTVIADYTSVRDRQVNAITGRNESIYQYPINSDLGNIVTEKLREYEGTNIFGMGLDLETYHTILPQKLISEDMENALSDTKQEDYELLVEIIPVDTYNYKNLCEKAGVPMGSTILLNHYSYNDNGNLVEVIPYQSTLTEITSMKADGSQSIMKIDGILMQEDIPDELIYPNSRPLRLVVPQADVRGYSWLCKPENEEGFIEFANEVLADIFPLGENAEYMEDGFTTRVYRTDEYMKVMNISIVLALVFMYSFTILIMFIGFTNVVSTLYANIFMRANEFAVLRSIGMTPEGLKKMLTLESILCSYKSLIWGVAIGVTISYTINLPIKKMYPVAYELPWLTIFMCILGVFGLTWAITAVAMRKLGKQNIIETIRSQNK